MGQARGARLCPLRLGVNKIGKYCGCVLAVPGRLLLSTLGLWSIAEQVTMAFAAVSASTP